MEQLARALASDYRRTVKEVLAGGGEACLLRAYDLGRDALANGLGVLDLVVAHHATLAATLGNGTPATEVISAAQSVLVEALSPFEIARREFRDARQALRRLNEALEEEARRIAHALHDEAGQLLVFAQLALADVARKHPEAKVDVDEASGILYSIEGHLRRMSHELRPTILDDLGLCPALSFLAEGVAARSGLVINVTGSTDGRLPPAVESGLYRVVQEALTNVVRHASAKIVRITVGRLRGAVTVSVRDDGVGLPRHNRPEAGIGLIGIRDRLESIGGSLRLVSNPDHGTTVEARVPLLEDPHAAAASAR
jgi:signal transduction histidine kinase